jgi:hypothetical protein
MIDKQRLLSPIKQWKHDGEMLQPAGISRKSENNAAPSDSIPTTDNTVVKFSPHARMMAYDLAAHFDEIYRDRAAKLGISQRQYKESEQELAMAGLVKRVEIGKIVLLAPTKKLYTALGLESPYKRPVSEIDHAFLCRVAAQLIKTNPLVQAAECEVYIGDSNSTVDVVGFRKDGLKFAYEITCSAGNVTANAAKLQNKGFAEVIFVCRDSNIRQAAWADIRNAGFNPSFRSTIRVMLFSNLFKQKKQFEV